MKNINSILKSRLPHKLKKKMTVLPLFLLMATGGYSQTSVVAVGSNIYEINHTTCTETLVCSSLSVNTGGGTTTAPITDIAYHPNGNLYGIVANYFVSIDLGACTTSTIASHSTGSNALVTAADGTVYAAADDLYTVDINTGVFTSLGTLPCSSAGDLTFHEGELYLSCDNGDLLNVNITNPASSSVVGNLGTGNWHGLWTVHTDCNNSQVLAASQNEVYELNVNTAATNLICTLTTSWIGGATMIGDYNASECGCSVNLGPNQNLCSGEITLNVGALNSTYLWQDATTDSTLTITSPGTYYVEVTDTIEACASSDTIVVSGPYPPEAGTFGSSTVCNTDAPFDLITVLGGTPDSTGVWSPALNSGTGIFDPAVDSDGVYTYTVTNDCGTAQTDIDISVINCGVGMDENASQVLIYPSPSTGMVNVLIQGSFETTILITDVSGRIIQKHSNVSNKTILDLSAVANGTYFISFLDNENKMYNTEKIQILK